MAIAAIAALTLGCATTQQGVDLARSGWDYVEKAAEFVLGIPDEVVFNTADAVIEISEDVLEDAKAIVKNGE